MQRILISSLLALAIVGPACAEETELQARNAAECHLFADMAIVARALVEKSVDVAQQRPVMETIYQPDDARTNLVLDRILGAARRTTDSAPTWASSLGEQCVLRRGNLQELLGSES